MNEYIFVRHRCANCEYLGLTKGEMDGHFMRTGHRTPGLFSLLSSLGKKKSLRQLAEKYPFSLPVQGEHFLSEEEFVKAVEVYTLILALEPESASAFANRALASTALGLDIEAQSDFDHAVNLGADRIALEATITEIKNRG